MPDAPSNKKPDKVDEKIRTSGLLDLYGGLLSRKQRDILRLYADEDLGYSEIADHLQITRQAVFDAVRQACGTLEKFENHLGLLRTAWSGKETGQKNELDDQQEIKAGPPTRESVQGVVESIERMASEDILYDTGKLRKAIQRLKELLQPFEE